MKNSEKLDFLMKLVGVTNIQLARAAAFDASYISRIRSGKRNMPKRESFLRPLTAFLAKNITKDYQRDILAEMICPGQKWSDDEEKAEFLLYEWLSEKENAEAKPDEQFPTGLSAQTDKFSFEQKISAREAEISIPQTGFYYGSEGKCAAVELFLKELCAMDTPQTLLLYSNEDMNWLYEDSLFAKRWTTLMTALIKKGGRVRIIHTISRDAGDMLTAVRMWMPLYLSGAIEPYFYPKLRDRVYKRTLFIAKDRSAIFSDSVGTDTCGMLNVFIHDKNAVRALEAEFMSYLKLCRPLMRVFNKNNMEMFLELFRQFAESDGELIAAFPLPFPAAAPEETSESVSARCGDALAASRSENAEAHLESRLKFARSLTDIIRLPDIRQLKTGEFTLSARDPFACAESRGTADKFKAQLAKMLEKLKSHADYNVTLSDAIPKSVIIYAKDDIGVIVINAETPLVALCVNERRITSAFWEYLTRIRERGESREKTIETLENYIARLSE